MERISLNGDWFLKGFSPSESVPVNPDSLDPGNAIPAIVPGNVELDLLAAGLIGEPKHGNNVYELKNFERHTWWIWREFNLTEIPTDKHPWLVFEGVDCFADVWLNGVLIGKSDNMLIEHRFDASGAIRSGMNSLAVRLRPAVTEGWKHHCPPGEFAADVNIESLSVRKAPHMYGWDIMPRIVSAGLWRPVRLEFEPAIHWESVYWTTLSVLPSERKATILVDWQFSAPAGEVENWKVVIRLKRGGDVKEVLRPVLGAHGRWVWELETLDLWWPRGLGEAALYEAELELLDASGQTVALSETVIGIRTVVLRRTNFTSEEEPGEFVFVVNGEKVFIKGTNWVPLDAFHSCDPLHLEKTVEMLADLNCNMVRCWGGNVYEDHPFFDLCDRLGILVWQDFAMACAVYPQSDAFEEVLRKEAESVVTKLRNHPCLALWVGNNEGDEAYGWARTGLDPNDDRPTRKTLPEVLRALDPLRPYLPSSPYHSPEMHRTGDLDRRPETHLWGPRGDYKAPYYTETKAHFVSEIGYLGCPGRASLESFVDADHLWPWQDNDQWLTHCVRPVRNTTAYNYRVNLLAIKTTWLFGSVPDNLDDFILASQVVQAEALKFFIEFWRMGKWRRTGILWWNLRDGWPILSDAVVDYYFAKKLAYHYIKTVQQDVCVMVGEAEGGRHPIVAVNDALREVRGTLAVKDESGRVLLERTLQIRSNSIATIGDLPAPPASAQLYLLEWEANGVSGKNHYLAGPRPIALETYRSWLRLHLV